MSPRRSGSRVGLRAPIYLLAVLASVAPTRSAAQTPLSAGEPARRGEALASAGGVLPPLALPEPAPTPGSDSPGGGGALWDRDPLYVPGIRVFGNSVLPDVALRELLVPYAGRAVRFEELLELRDALTRLYVRAGYVTSGAVLRSRRAPDGFVEYRVVEGVLGAVRIAGASRYREDALRDALRTSLGSVVRMQVLESRLRELLQDPRIENLEARLVPGTDRGSAELELAVSEGPVSRLSFSTDNYQSPAVGFLDAALARDLIGHARLTRLNLLGSGDALQLSYDWARGLNQARVRYERPVGSRGTTLGARSSWSATRVVEAPLDVLELESRSLALALDVRQRWIRREGFELNLSLAGEYRRNEGFLGGERFSLDPSREDPVVELAVLQIGQEFSVRRPRWVLAARSVFRWGLDALGARIGPVQPDGRFRSWLGQIQWVSRLPVRDATLRVRGSAQLSPDPLPGIERFGLGGHSTVRGYRENAVARSSGWAISLEVRIPLWRGPRSASRFELRPFFDLGQSWESAGATPRPRRLASAGVGFGLQLREDLHVELYYAHAFHEAPASTRRLALQDRGIHFRIRSQVR